MEHPFDLAGIMSLNLDPDSGRLQLDGRALPGVPSFSLNHLDGFMALVAEPDRKVFGCVITTLIQHLGRYRPAATATGGEWVLETGFRLGLANSSELQVQLLVLIVKDPETKQPVWQWMIRQLPPVEKPSFWALVHGPATGLLPKVEGCMAPKKPLKFTPAEMEVIHLLASGLKPEGIAEKLGSKLDTVRTHIRNARKKAGVINVPGLVNTARDSGLLK